MSYLRSIRAATMRGMARMESAHYKAGIPEIVTAIPAQPQNAANKAYRIKGFRKPSPRKDAR